MRKFIVKTAWLVLPILLGAVFMEFVLRRIPNDFTLKNNYLEAHANEIETLILGSSHAYFGLDPYYFAGKTFNAGEASQSLDLDDALFRKHRDRLTGLKTIVLPVTYVSLFTRLQDTKEYWRIKNYIIYYGLDIPHNFSDHFELLSSKGLVNLKEIAAFYGYGHSNLYCNPLGWGTGYGSGKAQDLQRTGKTAAERHSRDIRSKMSRSNFSEFTDDLDSMADWCERHDIDLILLMTPTFETYRANLHDEQLSVTVKTLAGLDSRYPHCVFRNYMDDTSFVAGDFYDADHLSDIGARKLSKKVNALVLERRRMRADNTAALPD